MKSDGKLSYRGEVTPLQRVMLERRSFRKYRPERVTPEQAAEVQAAAGSFCEHLGYRAPAIRVTTDQTELRTIIQAACTGAIGKTNPWLPFTKASGLILALGDVDRAPVVDDRVIALAETAMTMEVAILRATELGLGTCWMAGINGREIERSLSATDQRQLIAISPLGYPPGKISLLSWDGMAYHLVSKRRKPLSDILFAETLGDAGRWRPTAGASEPDHRGAPAHEATATGAIMRLVRRLVAPDSFAPGQIAADAIEALFQAARVAPSADNAQTWRFVTVRDPARRAALLAAVPEPSRSLFAQAPLLVAVLAEPWIVKGSRREQPFFMLDVPIAISHVALQAAELDLACAIRLDVDESAAKAAVGAGQDYRTVAVLAVGHPG